MSCQLDAGGSQPDLADDSDEDKSSVVSLLLFSPPHSTVGSHTTFDASLRSGSPTPSVRTMTSSIRTQAYRQEFGRGINNYSEVYRLPADEEELARLGESTSTRAAFMAAL